ncbi:hypothetical protein [Streptomyces sp. NBC_00310]|uniref:hypothetical protein n=2 Tax=unclassified Streptomyces TaxID=2593676 RepID=UPI002E23068A
MQSTAYSCMTVNAVRVIAVVVDGFAEEDCLPAAARGRDRPTIRVVRCDFDLATYDTGDTFDRSAHPFSRSNASEQQQR